MPWPLIGILIRSETSDLGHLLVSSHAQMVKRILRGTAFTPGTLGFQGTHLLPQHPRLRMAKCKQGSEWSSGERRLVEDFFLLFGFVIALAWR